MKRFSIKEEFWSLSDDFFIYNEQGEEVFRVYGKPFSWGDKLSFQSMGGEELAYISQKILSWNPCYEIYRDGEMFAKIVKEFSWFKKRFTLDVPGPNDYTIEGSFWAHDFQFTRKGEPVASVSKAVWATTDSYGVAIEDEEDEVSILCAAIVIDQVLHEKNASN